MQNCRLNFLHHQVVRTSANYIEVRHHESKQNEKNYRPNTYSVIKLLADKVFCLPIFGGPYLPPYACCCHETMSARRYGSGLCVCQVSA